MDIYTNTQSHNLAATSHDIISIVGGEMQWMIVKCVVIEVDVGSVYGK